MEGWKRKYQKVKQKYNAIQRELDDIRKMCIRDRNIVETEQLVEMLKQNGIAAFSQEAGANFAMHGAPGFGIYGVDIFVKTDDAEKAVQLIKEINNQENEENF